jgi:hypothetical protein
MRATVVAHDRLNHFSFNQKAIGEVDRSTFCWGHRYKTAIESVRYREKVECDLLPGDGDIRSGLGRKIWNASFPYERTKVR